MASVWVSGAKLPFNLEFPNDSIDDVNTLVAGWFRTTSVSFRLGENHVSVVNFGQVPGVAIGRDLPEGPDIPEKPTVQTTVSAQYGTPG